MEHLPGWTTLAEQPLVLLKEYSFGPAIANCVAVQLPGDKWLLMSPPTGLTQADAAALSARGEVVALVENNGFHHLGLASCAALFPRAQTYARERAAARIRKKEQHAGALLPIETLTPLLGPHVELIAVDGDKLGDVLLRVRTERGVLLYVGDYITNMPRLPKSVVARLLFRLSDSAPGLKLFKLYLWFFTADRAHAKASLLRAIDTAPPTLLVPAHGETLEAPGLSGQLRALFA